MQPVPKRAASLFYYAYLRTIKQEKYYEKRRSSQQATPLCAILFLKIIKIT